MYHQGIDGLNREDDEFIGGAIGGSQGGARKKMFKNKECSPGKNDVEGSCLDNSIILIVAHFGKLSGVTSLHVEPLSRDT